MTSVDRRWQLSSSHRPLGEPVRLPPAQVAALRDEVAQVPDNTQVRITAGMLRALLTAHERPAVERSVTVDDDVRRVRYLVTVGRGDGRVWPKSVEVVPYDEETTPDTWRVPAQTLADRAAALLAEQDATDPDRPEDVVIWGASVPREGVPNPEELRAMVREGMTRTQIAKATNRSVSRVDEWLREARQERPDLDWPARKRGPKPRSEQGRN